MILLSFLIPFLFFTMVISKPAPKKLKYIQSKVYSVVLLDKNGKRLKDYTYIK